MSHTRCAFIGPCPSKHKGGVAQFSGRLADELAQRTDLCFISWNQIYPSFLISRGLVTDSPCGPSNNVEAEPILSCLNPATWRVAVKRILRHQPDLVLFTWVHPVHAPILRFLSAGVRSKGERRITAICHNVLPHETFPGAHLMTRYCLTAADELVVHSGDCAREARHVVGPHVAIKESFLPLFDFFGRVTDAPPQWRPEGTLRLLFFGAVRYYKGVDLLLRALPRVIDRYPAVHLTVAGEPFFRGARIGGAEIDLAEEVRRLGLERHVSLELRYIPDTEVPHFFSEADLVVFPYRSVTQSAAVTVAFSFAKPVLCSALGGLRDVVREGETGYFFPPDDPAALADAVLRFIRRPLRPAAIVDAACGLSWSKYVDALLDH